MVRVVTPGGTVATYVWDNVGGGSPTEPIHVEMRTMGITPLSPPSAGASRMDALRDLWTAAGLEAVETREITVRRTFADFDDFWRTTLLATSVGPTVAAMHPNDVERLKARAQVRLPPDSAGRITYGARANAVKGYTPT
jgi:hypothetical protein